MRLRALAVKELVQAARDPGTLLLLILLPAAMLLLFGFALTLEVERVPLAVLDQDRSPRSRALVDRFVAADAFRQVAAVDTPADLQAALDRGRARAALAIPPGYARALRDGRPASVQLLVDGADANSARVAIGYAEAIGAREGAEVLAETITGGAPLRPAFEARARVFYNPGLESAHFLVPGLLAVVVLVTAVLMTATSFARERELGTLEALLVTPLGRLELLLGKTVPFLLLALLDVGLALLAARVVFGVPARGSPLVVGGATLLFVVAALGYGLLVSTVARSQQAAFQMTVMTTLLPAFLLSGFVFPVENMVAPVQAIAACLPTRYYVDLLRAVLLKGAPAAAVAGELWVLGGFACLTPLLALRRFERQVRWG